MCQAIGSTAAVITERRQPTINPNYDGAVSFTGSNTYNGNTTVNGGTFFANNNSGSATGNGNVFVNSGATLAGTGWMTGIVTVNSGATLAPGDNGTGILRVGNSGLATQSLILSGTLSLEIGDLAAIGGNLSLTLVNGFTPMLGDHFFIIDDTSSDPALRTTRSFANAPGGFVT